MRRTVALGSALVLAAVVAACSNETAESAPVGESLPVSTPHGSAAASVEAAEPELDADGLDPVTDESPGASRESDEAVGGSHEGTLEPTFIEMLDAMEHNGEAGLMPYLADPEAGDMWGVSDWEWTAGPCVEGGLGESACVGTFVKEGVEIENVFGFEAIDGQWLLVESWVPGH